LLSFDACLQEEVNIRFYLYDGATKTRFSYLFDIPFSENVLVSVRSVPFVVIFRCALDVVRCALARAYRRDLMGPQDMKKQLMEYLAKLRRTHIALTAFGPLLR
jgi:hypothetical protein